VNRITPAVTMWRNLIAHRKMKVAPMEVTDRLRPAVLLILADAVLDGRITPTESRSLEAILERGADADPAERTVLAEAICELRDIPGLSARFGDDHRVLHRRLM